MTRDDPSRANATPGLIGGVFGLEEGPDGAAAWPSFLKGSELLLLNGRSGISLVIRLLSPTRVWMPSYLCEAMLKAVDPKGVAFFAVDQDLCVSSTEWLDELRPGDLVVLIDYFGFPCDERCATRARERGAWVLEDACQALLSDGVGRCSDFVLFSPRKFLGIPDGGILRVNGKLDLAGVELERPPAAWWLKSFRASLLRREFDAHGGSRRWFELFQEAEAEAPCGAYAISELSEMLLKHAVNSAAIARRRIENYQYLADSLADMALFKALPPGVVPLGFPIRTNNRERVRQHLFDCEIYPALPWPLPGMVPEQFGDSHRLAAEIMTLPCDQRYARADMNRMAQAVWRACGR